MSGGCILRTKGLGGFILGVREMILRRGRRGKCLLHALYQAPKNCEKTCLVDTHWVNSPLTARPGELSAFRCHVFI